MQTFPVSLFSNYKLQCSNPSSQSLELLTNITLITPHDVWLNSAANNCLKWYFRDSAGKWIKYVGDGDWPPLQWLQSGQNMTSSVDNSSVSEQLFHQPQSLHCIAVLALWSPVTTVYLGVNQQNDNIILREEKKITLIQENL